MSQPHPTLPRILIIDDEAAHRSTLTSLLQPDYDLSLASNEAEALASLATRLPDLILLDADLGRAEGYAICRRLKAEKSTSLIPIIMLTELLDAEIEAQIVSAGAQEYLLKPFNPGLVSSRVKRQFPYQQTLVPVAALASTDELTQVMNRQALLERIPEEIARCRRVDAPISLIVLDIDYFRKYNDRYGREAGDECLRRVAQVLNSVVSRPADLVARYDGESFAIILPDTDILGASVIAEAACAAVQAQEIEHAESPISDCVSISLGVVCKQPEDKRELVDLFSAADDALYRAKLAGRNGVALGS